MNLTLNRLDCFGRRIILPAAIAVFVWWNVPMPSIKSVRPAPVLFVDNEDVFVQPPLEFNDSTNQVVYDIWVEDNFGQKVFAWPRIMLERKTGVDPNSMTVKFPSGLPRGEYRITGMVYYRANPISTQNISVDLARVHVVR